LEHGQRGDDERERRRDDEHAGRHRHDLKRGDAIFAFVNLSNNPYESNSELLQVANLITTVLRSLIKLWLSIKCCKHHFN